MTVFVLDNSVTMRWFFDAGSHAQADAVLQALTEPGSEALVPPIWRYEVSAVLARAEVRASIPSQEVTDFLRDLEALPIRVDAGSDAHIFTDVHRLAVTYRLTSYDAAYLELAQRRTVPLATLDEELITACRIAGIGVV